MSFMTGIKMPYTNKTLRPQGDAVLVTGGKKKHASINDVHLLDSGHRPTEGHLSSSGFRGQVDVLLKNGVPKIPDAGRRPTSFCPW